MSKKATSPLINFEANLEKIETIVNAMETGNLTLEQALVQFETGISLVRDCQQTLKTAQERVQTLMIHDDK